MRQHGLRWSAPKTAPDLCRLQEVGILKGLNYDRNIVQFYGACIREACDPLLITEYMEGAPAVCLRGTPDTNEATKHINTVLSPALLLRSSTNCQSPLSWVQECC